MAKIPPGRQSRLAETACAELAFEFPGLAVGFKRFPDPAERIGRNFGEAPAGWCAVHSRPSLHNLVVDLPTRLALLVAGYRIDPADSPRLNCRIPDAQGGTVHVVHAIGIPRAVGTARHDPDVLDGATFKHPSKMSFASDLLRSKVDRSVMQNFEFPTPNKPTIRVGRFGNFV